MLVCRVGALVEGASSSFFSLFHLTYGGRVDLISLEFTVLLYFSARMAEYQKEIDIPEEETQKEVGVPNEDMVPVTDTGYSLDWVAMEPLNIVSRFVHDSRDAYNVFEDMDGKTKKLWEVMLPKSHQRIRSSCLRTRFPMYEFAL